MVQTGCQGICDAVAEPYDFLNIYIWANVQSYHLDITCFFSSQQILPEWSLQSLIQVFVFSPPLSLSPSIREASRIQYNHLAQRNVIKQGEGRERETNFVMFLRDRGSYKKNWVQNLLGLGQRQNGRGILFGC